MAGEDHRYHPKDALGAGISGLTVLGSAGLLLSAVQNTLARRNVGAWGVFTRSGSTIAIMTAMGGTYGFTTAAAANLRETDDSINPAIGGFFAGSLLGFKHGSMPKILGFGALAAVTLGAFNYTGGQLTGYSRSPELDEFERKQQLRANRRRPIEQTIAEVGEGRGAVYAPGYYDRRKELLKEKYGVDVPGSTA